MRYSQLIVVTKVGLRIPELVSFMLSPNTLKRIYGVDFIQTTFIM